MNNLFVPYEQALHLKELGFNEPCMFPYHRNNTDYVDSTHVALANYNATEKLVSAVLYQQAFDWFRKQVFPQIVINEKGDYVQGMLSLLPLVYHNTYVIHLIKASTSHTIDNFSGAQIPSYQTAHKFNGNAVPTYEEAQLACLKKLIEIVKGKEVAICCHTNS